MEARKVTRYIAECGRGFWKKQRCLEHEKICKCWTNPRNRTCKTCEFGEFVRDEPDVGEASYWDCWHENGPDEHSGAPHGIKYISVNCGYYRNKQGE